MPELVFHLTPAAPFRLDLTAWALRRRPENEIDLWDGTFYRRTFFPARSAVAVSVRQVGAVDKPRLEITAASKKPLGSHEDALRGLLDRTLGLRVDLTAFYEIARRDAKIGPMVKRFAGFRPPRFPTAFEAITNAVACQQLSLTVGLIILNRLARTQGKESGAAGIGSWSPAILPSPRQLAAADPSELHKIGFSQRKTHALINIAERFVADQDHFGELEPLDDAAVFTRLLSLRGIGRWSAEYVMLRGLGRLNVFPADDVAGQKNLHRWLGLRKIPSYDRARRLLAGWHPYEGLLYFHFLLSNLEAHGIVHGAAE
ncbi:MAG: DNA-3-methyladenine glycosylase family protein [Candidatus Binataceae bacterium]